MFLFQQTKLIISKVNPIKLIKIHFKNNNKIACFKDKEGKDETSDTGPKKILLKTLTH